MRRSLSLMVLAILLGVCGTGMVLARDLIQGEQCTVEEDEVIEGTLFTFCQVLTVAGRVEGNIIGIALRANIRGEVTDSVYIAGTQLNVTGTIGRDLHYGGIVLNVSSPDEDLHTPVKGQIIFVALSADFDESIQVDGQITGIGYQLLIDAEVDGEINFWGSAFILNSTINNNVYATVGNPESDGSELEPLLIPLNITQAFVDPGMLVSEEGIINGTLTYFGPTEGQIDGRVNGRINYSSSTPIIIPIAPEEGTFNIFVNQFTREVSVLLTVGLASLLFAPNVIHTPISNLRWRPVPSFVIGMLMFIVSFPIALILLLLTAIIVLIVALLQLDGVLIVVASFLGLLDVGVIGTFYFVAIFVARVVFCLGLGRFLVRTTLGNDHSNRMTILSLLVGVVLLAFLSGLPAVGFLFNAAALFMGLGAITNVFLEWLQTVRDTTYTNVRSTRFERAPLPPRLIPAADAPALPQPNHTSQTLLRSPADDVGLRDLPDGFDPDFFFNDD